MAASAAPTHIRAFMIYMSPTTPSKVQSIETDATPFMDTIPNPPSDLTPSEKEAFTKQKLDEFCDHNMRQYMRYLNQSASEPKYERRRLPTIQPKCPDQWSEKAWNGRLVFGNDNYHAFRGLRDSESQDSHPDLDMFVLKVSSRLDSDGRWMYEDLPLTLANESRQELIDFFKSLKSFPAPSPTVHD